MNDLVAVEIGTQAIKITLMIALPLLMVSLVVGLAISLFQVATSLQDVTLTFVPKIVAVGMTLIFASHWIMGLLISFTKSLLSDFGAVIG